MIRAIRFARIALRIARATKVRIFRFLNQDLSRRKWETPGLPSLNLRFEPWVWCQEVSEYGFVYGSKRWKSQFSVDSQLRTQLRKPPPQSYSKGKFFVRVRFGGFRVRLRRLSEYGPVACLVERPTWETRAEQYSDTILWWTNPARPKHWQQFFRKIRAPIKNRHSPPPKNPKSPPP